MYKITDITVIDHNEGNRDPEAGSVSVLVTIKIDDEEYSLDFQTTHTNDYGAISSNLSAYDGDSHYGKLEEIFGDKFEDFLDGIKQQSEVSKIWDDYIDENYIRDDRPFGGMDGNSECNSMMRKSD